MKYQITCTPPSFSIYRNHIFLGSFASLSDAFDHINTLEHRKATSHGL